MTVQTKISCGNDLRTALRTLIADCQREATRLTKLARRGCSGYRAKGRADACKDVAVWLERICRNSSDNLPIALNDLIQCLQQSVEDERFDARSKRRRMSQKRNVIATRRFRAEAIGRASTYADIQEVLSQLLALHYPNQQFPLTLTGKSPDDNESVLPFDSSERVRRSSQAEPVSADIR